MSPFAILLALGLVVIVAVGAALLIKRAMISIPDHQALIIHRPGRPSTVAFHAAVVPPLLGRGEIIDLSIRHVHVALTGREGVLCRDNIRADVKATFHLKINRTAHDVLKVAQSVGVEASGRQEAIEALFADKFADAIQATFKQFDFDLVLAERERVRDQTLMIIGDDLNGFALDDMAYASIHQTPVEALDPQSALDAEGIRRITQRAADAQIESNRLKHDLALRIAQQDLEAQHAILKMERQQAEAHALMTRDIAAVRARHEAESLITQVQQQALIERATLQARADAGLPSLDTRPAPSAPPATTSAPPTTDDARPAPPASKNTNNDSPLQGILDKTRADTQSLLKKNEG